MIDIQIEIQKLETQIRYFENRLQDARQSCDDILETECQEHLFNLQRNICELQEIYKLD